MELPTHCYDCGAYLMGGATVHKPDCSIRDMIEHSTAFGDPLICDFCSDPNPTWSLDCATYVCSLDDDGVRNLGAWLACEACEALIRGEDWHALAVRSREKTDSGVMLTGFLGEADALEKIMKLHRGFREHATGKACRL